MVRLRVNCGECTEIRAGQAVTLTGTIEVPPSAGSIVSARWDFDGSGEFEHLSPVRAGATTATVSITHRFDRPGTYFPALIAASQRDGNPQTPYARIRDLDRVRVVVK